MTLDGGAGSSGERSALSELVARYKGRMSLLAGVSFLGALAEALFLVGMTGIAMALIDDSQQLAPVLGHSATVGLALGLLAVLLAIRLGLSILGVQISTRLTAEVTTEQRQVVSDAYLRSSWDVQQSEPAGRLQELLTSFVGRVTGAVSTLTQAITATLSLIAFIGTGLALDPIATLAVIVALMLVGAILVPVRNRIRQTSRTFAGANLEFANAVSELGSLGLEMQTFGVRQSFAARIEHLTLRTANLQRQVLSLQGSLAPLYMTLAYAAILAGVAVLTGVGFDSLGVIGGILLLMLRSLSYGQQLSSAAGALAASAPFLDQVRDTVRRYQDSAAAHGDGVPAGVTPLVADRVSFAYAPSRPALSDLRFTIAKGEAIGVIGPSGAGKSTLAQLLLGLREPTSGTLTAAGIELSVVDRHWWTQRVAFVPQDAQLMTGTVAENIRFLRDGIDDAALRRAVMQANILGDIEALPHGFETHLGERGTRLSGGQRQRLSIARALAGDPELLILDEPTSALDSQSEALIRKSLADLRGRITVVIIAHRMSTVDMCDRIMVIEHGQITAFDRPAVLFSENEFYRRVLAISGGPEPGAADR
jgi:ABC-type multidrug transport system fused ATPase/permease subunit